ncbi:MAG: FIST C-terminal domain-containing protein [Polyangiaceae bacterium]|nr:FIST C-terminal domain-containing protein [Polyangiaceae bacterium]
MAGATSFVVQTRSAARAARELAAALPRVARPAGALVFASGALAESAEALARELGAAAPGVPLLLATGAGVLTERGEVENDSAAAGVIWAGGRTEVLSITATGADEAMEGLARALTDRSATSAPTALSFVRPEGFSPASLEPLWSARVTPHLFGAGTTGVDPICIDAEGRLTSGRAAALLIRGLSAPVIRSSPACRLLSPLRRITETRGALVTRIEGEPALDALSAVGEALAGQPLVFAVLGEGDPGEGRPELLVRAVQGVDPVRRGLLISDEVREGTLMAFAVRDPARARADLEAAARDALRTAAGAAPRFGIYVSCAGRGAALYGSPDVDTKILRSRFGDMPFAGLASSFEIAPHAGRASLQLYTGVIALFSAPS